MTYDIIILLVFNSMGRVNGQVHTHCNLLIVIHNRKPSLMRNIERDVCVYQNFQVHFTTIIYNKSVPNFKHLSASASVAQSTTFHSYQPYCHPHKQQAVECQIHIEIEPTQASSPKQQENVQGKHVYHDPKPET